MQERNSRFRAKWFAEHPPSDADKGLSFLGWSQDSALLVGIHNAILAVNGGKKARKFMLDGPKAQRKPQLFAPTIKDFNVGRFMGVINGARK